MYWTIYFQSLEDLKACRGLFDREIGTRVIWVTQPAHLAAQVSGLTLDEIEAVRELFPQNTYRTRGFW